MRAGAIVRSELGSGEAHCAIHLVGRNLELGPVQERGLWDAHLAAKQDVGWKLTCPRSDSQPLRSAAAQPARWVVAL